MPGVLERVRVLDYGRYIAGPYCATLLAEFGAEVIRVEKRGGSEDRFVAPVGAGGEGALFPADQSQQEMHHARPDRGRRAGGTTATGREVGRGGRQPAAEDAASDEARLRNAEGDQVRHYSHDRDRARRTGSVVGSETAKIPAGPVLSPQQALDHPHIRAAGFMTNLDYPGLSSPAPIARAAVRLSQTPGRNRQPTPDARRAPSLYWENSVTMQQQSRRCGRMARFRTDFELHNAIVANKPFCFILRICKGRAIIFDDPRWCAR
jgi:crotonobetainyl-CoA:carnitine CoA-transferase CaiB-like acyl-CoA transferase